MFSVYSIFDSIDGEVNAFHQGAMTTFIRFSGCNLLPKCSYCDTPYALKETDGSEISLEDLVNAIFLRHKTKKVTITGGEPLLQKDLHLLLSILIEKGVKISIETNGTLKPLQQFIGIPEVSWVYDFKLKNSGQRNRMNLNSFSTLTNNDFVKFLVSNTDDIEEALSIGEVLRNNYCEAKYAFSPIHGQLEPDDLLRLLQKLGTGDEIINLQLHKYIWGTGTANEEH